MGSRGQATALILVLTLVLVLVLVLGFSFYRVSRGFMFDCAIETPSSRPHVGPQGPAGAQKHIVALSNHPLAPSAGTRKHIPTLWLALSKHPLSRSFCASKPLFLARFALQKPSFALV